MSGTGKEMIYSVTFHQNPGKKVHTFWFTDKWKAIAFYESVKKHPKGYRKNMYGIVVPMLLMLILKMYCSPHITVSVIHGKKQQ